jgi:RHS repeat-associated protein
VVHSSGLVEVLRTGGSSDRPLALPVEVLGADGRRVRLTYVPFNGGRRLETVSDDSGELLRVERSGDAWVDLLFFPGRGADAGALARFELRLDGSKRVTKVILPTEELASWRLAYETLRDIGCLTEVWTPTGAHETMDYRDAGHGFPGNAHPALPRVTRHVVEPGFGQPDMEVGYHYTDSNFLGLGALSSWSDDGLDNLYKVANASFSYGSTATSTAAGSTRTVERRFNRFHLMTDEITTQGACRKHVVTTHYADHPDHRNKPFDQQPPQCQLPMTVETRWELTNDNTKVRRETAETRFDVHGNLTERINADGTREVSEYYPAEGDGLHCPKDPEGFVRSLRARTVYPAPSTHGAAPTLRTELDYIALPPLPGAYSTPFLVEQQRTLLEVGGAELQRTRTEYFDDPTDVLQLGRARSMSETLNGQASFTDYQYTAGHSARLDEDMLEITETLTGFDGSTQTIRQQHSLRNGQLLLSHDLDGVEVRHAYDALGRMIGETIAPGTAYEASRSYAYHLVGGDGDSGAWQLATDVQGVQTRTRFDGLSRAILEERQDTDTAVASGLALAAAVFRPTYQARHNGLDQAVEETVFDWLGSDDTRALTHRYEYDDWGERCRTRQPDGVSEVTDTSPFGLEGPVRRRWLESAGSQVAVQIADRRTSHFNRFGKTLREVRTDDSGSTVFTLLQYFDGLGQCVESHEVFDDQERITRFGYDAWRRVVATTLPDGTLVSRRFAGHSSEELPVDIRVKPANTSLPEVVVGQQEFDGLDRLRQRTVGGRSERFGYDGGAPFPQTRTTPAQAQIRFDYAVPLGQAPRSVTTPDDAAHYQYDPHSGALLAVDNAQGERAYGYAYTGEIASERWTTHGGQEHLSQHTASRLGRPIQRLDSGPGTPAYAMTTRCEYDACGRLALTTQGTLRATVGYDDFGRPAGTTTTNTLTSQTLVNQQQYDTFGREVQRTLTVGGDVFTVTQQWQPDGQLERRVLQAGARSLLDESFHYDRRGRLQRHVCSGDECPQDRFGNAINQQVFTYDALDNITRCITTYADGNRDIADHTYADNDPCQLVEITHNHAAFPALEQYAYDADGNLLNDHQGNALNYDSLGRLLGIAAGSAQTLYHYDGHGELFGMRDAAGVETVRFYNGFLLNHAVRAGKAQHVLYADGHPLGQAPVDDGTQARLLLTTAIGSVIGEARQATVVTGTYTAYGEAGTALAGLLGYNGECRETNGWYLLGRGHRAYHPALMRFNRPDSLSPFGEGGINPYVYCGSNPVTFRDPSGQVRDPPDYIYPPPPVEQPSGGGGGWMKWLGVAISGVFLVASLVAAPWSLGLGAPLLAASLKGAVMQVAGIGLQVMGTLSTDPTMQMVGMIGGMVLGGGGAMASGKANAAATTLIRQQKTKGMQQWMTGLGGGSWTQPKAVGAGGARAPRNSPAPSASATTAGAPPVAPPPVQAPMTRAPQFAALTPDPAIRRNPLQMTLNAELNYIFGASGQNPAVKRAQAIRNTR